MRRENRLCTGCKAEFESRIVLKDGKEIISDYSSKCPTCRKKARELEERQQAAIELVKVVAEQRDLWVKQCNLPPKFSGKTFNNFKRQLQPKAYDIMKSYAYENGQSILLLSPGIYGVGKTHLAAALTNRIIKTNETAWIDTQYNSVRKWACPVLFVTANDLISRLRATFDHNERQGETEAEIYQQLENVDLLIIDDVGKVRARDPSFLQGVFFRVIDSRYVNDSDLILTTNLDFTELEEHIGGACADRLREMCGKNIVKMTGKSYRIQEIE